MRRERRSRSELEARRRVLELLLKSWPSSVLQKDVAPAAKLNKGVVSRDVLPHLEKRGIIFRRLVEIKEYDPKYRGKIKYGYLISLSLDKKALKKVWFLSDDPSFHMKIIESAYYRDLLPRLVYSVIKAAIPPVYITSRGPVRDEELDELIKKFSGKVVFPRFLPSVVAQALRESQTFVSYTLSSKLADVFREDDKIAEKSKKKRFIRVLVPGSDEHCFFEAVLASNYSSLLNQLYRLVAVRTNRLLRFIQMCALLDNASQLLLKLQEPVEIFERYTTVHMLMHDACESQLMSEVDANLVVLAATFASLRSFRSGGRSSFLWRVFRWLSKIPEEARPRVFDTLSRKCEDEALRYLSAVESDFDVHQLIP